jgi:glycosyltransferase involved in cell wall biosynthesis
MQALSVVITTFNEEKNIGLCLDSVRKVADEIIVLDSFSTDRTLELAKAGNAIVKQSVFDGYVRQKKKAIHLATYNFVLLLDADEALSETLSNSILAAKNDPLHKAFSMNRRNCFCGKFIRHGLWYPDKKIRLFDKGFAGCGGLDPHDKIILYKKIPVKHLKGALLHYTFDSIKEFQQRNDVISTIAAGAYYVAGIKVPWTKNIFSPVWAFFNGYILRFGFLDGYNGIIIAMLTANQCFLKYQKLRHLYKQEFEKVIWNKV